MSLSRSEIHDIVWDTCNGEIHDYAVCNIGGDRVSDAQSDAVQLLIDFIQDRYDPDTPEQVLIGAREFFQNVSDGEHEEYYR